MSGARLADRLTYAAYVVGWAVVRALPERLAVALFDAGARVAWRRQGKGTRRLRANLRRIVGPAVTEAELDRLTQAGLRSYGRYWREVFRLPVTSPDRVRSTFRLGDEDRLRKAYADGAGAIAVLPHQGNWDHAGAWACLTGLPLTTVAERLRPERLYDRFVAFRESLGMEVLPLTGGGPAGPFQALEQRLREGALLCLLGDRDLTARGVNVEFFGATARFPAGPAALALRTGAVLLPVCLWYDGEVTGGQVYEPVPHTTIAEMTQAVARAFEQGIRAHPEDWHMLQRLWLDDLAPGDPRRNSAAAP